VKVAFTNLDTGEIREQTVFLGNFPWMTDQGTFIINGTERVVVTQLVRSPGAYIMEPKDATKQVFVANLMPSRGSWLEMEIDKKGMVNVRIDRKRKLPVTTLLRALPAVDENTGFEIDKSDEGLLALFVDNPFIRMTLEKDPVKSEDAALVEVFKKQRPGEPPTVENSRNLVRSLFFDPKRYDLTKVGRYKLNMRLGQNVSPECRVLTTGDIVELIRRLVELPVKLNVPEDSKDYAADAIIIPRTEIEHDLDEYEHFGNRRLRTVGELIQEAFRIGLYRMERVVRERLTTEDEDAITPQTIVNIRPVVAALKEFFGSSQLSQFMDQTNSLAGLTHRRRLSALGAGGLTRERAPIEVRDVHPTHYGRMCPIETPEGPNIGLMGSLGSYAKVSEHGFVQTPYRKVAKGKITGEVEYLARDLALGDLAVRRLHEAVLRHLGVGAERAHEADVRAFRRLDRAHAAVVGRVHVAHLDRRALAREAAGAERRQAAAVREPRQRVGLIHELRELRGAEELLERGGDRTDVDD